MSESVNHKYTPLPKRRGSKEHNNHQLMIDLDALKELYLDGPHYRMSDFLRHHNFNPRYNKDLFKGRPPGIFQEWKKDWQRRQITNYDEELTPDLLSASKLVTIQRISFVKDWTKRAQNLKALFDMTMRVHYENFEADVRNADLIKSGAMQRRSKLTIEDLQAAGGAALRLQELEQRSLLVVGDPERLKALEQQNDDEIDDSREIVVSQIGKTMPQKDAIELMSSYFDQFVPQQKPAEIVAEAKPDVEADSV